MTLLLDKGADINAKSNVSPCDMTCMHMYTICCFMVVWCVMWWVVWTDSSFLCML